MASPSTPRRRPQRQKTRWTVRLADVLSRVVITVGGLGTIFAVFLVCAFLVVVAVPLFRGASFGGGQALPPAWKADAPPLAVGVDEHQVLGWALLPDGVLQTFRLDDGTPLGRRALFPEPRLTAFSPASAGDVAAFGFADGSVRLGKIGFQAEFLAPKDVPEEARELKEGEVWPLRGGLLTRAPGGQYRLQTVDVRLQPPIKGAAEEEVLLVDHSVPASGPVLCTLTGDRRRPRSVKLRLNTVSEAQNFMTGEKELTLAGADLPYDPPAGRALPKALRVSGVGDRVYVAWDDGHLLRYDTRDPEAARVAEARDLLPGGEARLTALGLLIGKETLLAGDSRGVVRAWFCAPVPQAGTPDGVTLVAAHTLRGPDAAVTALAPSSRTRTVAVGHADGRVRLFNVTSEKFLGEVRAGDDPVLRLTVAPKEDGLLGVTRDKVYAWRVDTRHPEVTLRVLFRPVWYEGSPQPSHTWQTVGATDAYEPKFGMVPLVFGTLKAAFYSLLFGVPIALLAAVFTSEFLHPRVKAVIKPTIELMASLPSVVLGFLAGLVFAAWVEQGLAGVLAAFLTVPLAFLAGAYLWQALPPRWAVRLGAWRVVFVALALPAGLLAAWAVGPALERVLFGGDLKGWLNSGRGPATGGWLLLLLPASAALVAVLMGRYLPGWLRAISSGMSRGRSAALDAGCFAGGVAAAGLLALGVALTLNALGLDLRGSLLGGYDARNALVVGFVMGFAIIPIIYTIAEDALSSVPDLLRSGSLACGATRWQTATRIVLPTAMSGLFSAVMVGMGRAVGETMIVLMATGNTPVLDWNVFNGFRTLSANIAVELPEAVKESTHYRILFLAALTLFIMTFCINTVAEVVRQRFRRRAYQL